MVAISAEILGPRGQLSGMLGAVVRAVILSDDTPASLTIDGSDVDGLGDDDVLAPGSKIITPSEEYVAFEEGVFTLMGASE